MAFKVKVQQGWLRGEILDLVTGDGQYYSFKGIPYGRPPIGKLRFKASLPALPWCGTHNATEHGNICPQTDLFTNAMIVSNEDCLYLNVYTGDLKPSKPKTVMFYIHGGGFKSGSGNVDYYSSDFLLKYDVVIVTINYRLDALGFLCMDTKEVPGNAGLKDQQLALKWVQENIAQFGGDPNSVTIFGDSAGGASTTMHVLSPMSNGLFQRAIALSGVSLCDWNLPFEPRRRAFALGKMLGCETKDSDILLDCLQNLPIEKLINTNPPVMSFDNVNNNVARYFPFVPVVEKIFGDDNFLTESSLTLLKTGKVNNVDIMVGHTSQETILLIPFLENLVMAQYDQYHELFVPRKICDVVPVSTILPLADKVIEYYLGDKPIDLSSMKEMVKCTSDIALNYDINKFIQLYPENGYRRYLYKFSCVSERNVNSALVGAAKYGLDGVAHTDDLMYLFDAKLFNLTIDKNGRSYKMVKQTCALFTNFAKYGIPTPDSSLGATWEEYDDKSESYLDINEVLTPGNHLDKDIINFWNDIYQCAGVDY